MMNICKKEFYDKVHGCWIGKNIGGTLGAPYEGSRELLHVTDFIPKSSRPLPNDDLDLQLIWLKALQERGPLGLTEQVLGEYWLKYMPAPWGEYGICKGNMSAGLLPPLSGDYENFLKNSNGAWIRSEIWACCAPGCPDIATRYAWCDACVDHGAGEGVFAELFTSSVESAAFVETDRDTLIKIGLSYIPADCRVARSIGIALDGFARGLDWKETRQLVLEDSADLGWFQAPANVAFVVIGWLYGEGDFKKSLLITTNCGDDTDCTAATLGSILGIIHGADALPDDWKKCIGDDIITVCVDRASTAVPRTCTELTDHIMKMAPQVLAAHRTPFIIFLGSWVFAEGALAASHEPISIGDGVTDLSDFNRDSLIASKQYCDHLLKMKRALRFDFIHTKVEMEYATGVNISAGQEATIQLTLYNMMPDPRHVHITYFLPEGFELLDGRKQLSLMHPGDQSEFAFPVRLRAGQTIHAANRGIIQMVAVGRPTVILIPILFLGQ